jgi:phosphatidylinositol-3-phosphatase
MIQRLLVLLAMLLVAACTPAPTATRTVEAPTPTASAVASAPAAVSPTEAVTGTLAASPTPASGFPNFAHIVILIFENREFGNVIDNPQMPTYNRLAHGGTLFTQYYATTHPSLPNYLSIIGGDTFGVTSNCNQCFIDAPSLPDLIEASGRTWKAYQESMTEPCLIGDAYQYAQKHNPFVYFDPIRTDEARCKSHVVPLAELDADLGSGQLANFVFITPNLCNSGHDCGLRTVDDWLWGITDRLLPALEATGEPYLLVLTWDEGQGSHSCCGLPAEAGGRIATAFVSPQVRSGFEDDTPYTHYSLLKTISAAWGLDYLGHAADDENVLIERPFE